MRFVITLFGTFAGLKWKWNANFDAFWKLLWVKMIFITFMTVSTPLMLQANEIFTFLKIDNEVFQQSGKILSIHS